MITKFRWIMLLITQKYTKSCLAMLVRYADIELELPAGMNQVGELPAAFADGSAVAYVQAGDATLQTRLALNPSRPRPVMSVVLASGHCPDAAQFRKLCVLTFKATQLGEPGGMLKLYDLLPGNKKDHLDELYSWTFQRRMPFAAIQIVAKVRIGENWYSICCASSSLPLAELQHRCAQMTQSIHVYEGGQS
jgi:hypothetical protein